MRKVFGIIIITILCIINTTGFAIQYIGGHGHHAPHCPFMPSEDGVCSMSLLEHFSVWKQVTQEIGVLPILVLITLTYTLIPKKVYTKSRESCYKHYSSPPVQTLLEILFTRGLLNSRVP